MKTLCWLSLVLVAGSGGFYAGAEIYHLRPDGSVAPKSVYRDRIVTKHPKYVLVRIGEGPLGDTGYHFRVPVGKEGIKLGGLGQIPTDPLYLEVNMVDDE